MGARSCDRILRPKQTVTIALVGKYVELKDAYISINEALYHAGIFHNAAVEIRAHRFGSVENDGLDVLRGAHGILVAPGFGARGVKGKLRRSSYARETEDSVPRHLLRHAARVRRVRAQRLRPDRRA